MNRLLFVVALMALAPGCKKPAPPPTDGNPAPQVAQPTPPSPPKQQEPPRLTPRHRFKTGIREVDQVAITDDGTRVAASSGLGDREQIEVWDLIPEPKKVREIAGLLRAFSPDGKLLVRTGSKINGVEVVDVTTGAAVCVISNSGYFHRFTGSDQLAAVRLVDGKPGSLSVSLYDARTGKRASGFEIPSPSHADMFGPVNGGREIVLGWGATSRIEVWDLSSGKLIRGVTLPNALPDGSWDNFTASPDGKRVTAQRRTDQPVGVYDTATGAEVATVGHPIGCRFVPNRNLILGHAHWVDEKFQAYGGWRAHDLTTKSIVADLPGAYLFPAISADGRVMVTMADRATPNLLVWDLTRIP